VIEVWETPEVHQSWFDEHVAPNLPPGVDRPEWEYIDLLMEVPG
jgi:hypothetical protein